MFTRRTQGGRLDEELAGDTAEILHARSGYKVDKYGTLSVLKI